MNDHIPSDAIRRYRVDLGHNSIVVESTSEAEAIRLARARLASELPRLWDVIQRLAPEKFQVSLLY